MWITGERPEECQATFQNGVLRHSVMLAVILFIIKYAENTVNMGTLEAVKWAG